MFVLGSLSTFPWPPEGEERFERTGLMKIRRHILDYARFFLQVKSSFFVQFGAFIIFLLCQLLNQPIFNAIERGESRLVFKRKLLAYFSTGVQREA